MLNYRSIPILPRKSTYGKMSYKQR